MIPKLLHQIWIGQRQISDTYLGFIQKWKMMYPDYKHFLWDDIAVNNEKVIPEDKICYFNSEKYPVALKADVLRYEIVKKYGGIYVDVDMEPLRLLDEEIIDCKFFGGIQNNGEVNIAIFGAEPGCPLIIEVCQNIVNNIEEVLKQKKNPDLVDELTGPKYFNKICMKYFDQTGYVFLHPKYFYPYWFTETHRRYEDFSKTCSEAFSVHHWAKQWK
jgi:mannosyltransferase OCH1-like enzyme